MKKKERERSRFDLNGTCACVRLHVCVCVCQICFVFFRFFASPLSVDDRMSDDFFFLSLFWFLLLLLFEKQCKRNKTKISLGEMQRKTDRCECEVEELTSVARVCGQGLVPMQECVARVRRECLVSLVSGKTRDGLSTVR